jgi:hypothetical protein
VKSDGVPSLAGTPDKFTGRDGNVAAGLLVVGMRLLYCATVGINFLPE